MHLDLSYLLKNNYDKYMTKVLDQSPVVSLMDLKNGQVQNQDTVRVIYHTKEVFKKIGQVSHQHEMSKKWPLGGALKQIVCFDCHQFAVLPIFSSFLIVIFSQFLANFFHLCPL